MLVERMKSMVAGLIQLLGIDIVNISGIAALEDKGKRKDEIR